MQNKKYKVGWLIPEQLRGNEDIGSARSAIINVLLRGRRLVVAVHRTTGVK